MNTKSGKIKDELYQAIYVRDRALCPCTSVLFTLRANVLFFRSFNLTAVFLLKEIHQQRRCIVII